VLTPDNTTTTTDDTEPRPRTRRLSSEGAKLNPAPTEPEPNATYSPRRTESLSARTPDTEDSAALSRANRSSTGTNSGTDSSYRSRRTTDNDTNSNSSSTTRSSYTSRRKD